MTKSLIFEFLGSVLVGRTLALRFLTLPLMALSVSACASKTIHDLQAKRELIFPYGEYRHSVNVILISNPALENSGQPKEFQFRGAVKVSPEQIKIIALSPVNTTLFRITDDRKTGHVETEVFVDSLKKVQSQMVEFYQVIRLLITTPSDAAMRPNLHATAVSEGPAKGFPSHLTASTPAGTTEIFFKDYDDHLVPTLITAENQKFTLQIKVTGYAL